MLVIGNNNNLISTLQTHRVLKDDSISSKLGRTTWFTFLYFLFFFFCVTNIYTKDNEVISCFPQPAWDLACKFSKLKATYIYTHK